MRKNFITSFHSGRPVSLVLVTHGLQQFFTLVLGDFAAAFFSEVTHFWSLSIVILPLFEDTFIQFTAAPEKIKSIFVKKMQKSTIPAKKQKEDLKKFRAGVYYLVRESPADPHI